MCECLTGNACGVVAVGAPAAASMAAPAVEDSFSVGESLAVIETDKASMNFEAQDDGVVAKLLVSTVA